MKFLEENCCWRTIGADKFSPIASRSFNEIAFILSRNFKESRSWFVSLKNYQKFDRKAFWFVLKGILSLDLLTSGKCDYSFSEEFVVPVLVEGKSIIFKFKPKCFVQIMWLSYEKCNSNVIWSNFNLYTNFEMTYKTKNLS